MEWKEEYLKKKVNKNIKSTTCWNKDRKEEKKATKVDTKKEDLSTKTVAELKDLAKKKEISGYTTMKKADLIKALN